MLIAHKIALDLNNEQATYNWHLARSISDMGFFELRRQLEYKAVSGSGRKTRVKPSSAKQEVSGGLAQQ